MLRNSRNRNTTPRNTNRRPTKMAALFFTLSFATIVSLPQTAQAQAHQWAVGAEGKKIEAELIDFNQHQILLQTTQDKRMVVDVKKLNDVDLRHLNQLVQLRLSIRNEQLQLAQLQQQRQLALNQYFDQWQVELIDNRGNRLVETFHARNNAQAARQALQRYPFATVGYVKKMRRRSFNF